jgi:hypothetical protein
MTDAILISGDGWKPVAKAINDNCEKGLDFDFKNGQLLIAAKEGEGSTRVGKFEHGTFQLMIREKLKFDTSTANKLMVMARHPIISKEAYRPLLPTVWTKAHKLTFVADDTLIAALADGRIHPKLTDADIRVLRGLETAKPIEAKQMSEHHNKTNAALKESLKEANRQNKQSREINQQLTQEGGTLRIERDYLQKQDDARRADPFKAFNDLWELADADLQNRIRDITNGRVHYLKATAA